jgi:hypothetical protein
MYKNTFIGNIDNEEEILMALSLDDLRHFCQTDVYFNQLCKTSTALKSKFKTINEKINYIISLSHKKDKGVIVQPLDDKAIYNTFRQIIDKVNFRYEELQENEDTIYDYDHTVFNDSFVNKIKIYYKPNSQLYHILFDVGEVYDKYYDYIDSVNIYVTQNQLHEILLHLYFNGLII